MRVRYYGKKVVRNEFGDVVKRFPPCADIMCKADELGEVVYRVEKTGWNFDVFCDADTGTVMVWVEDRADYDEFVDQFRG